MSGTLEIVVVNYDAWVTVTANQQIKPITAVGTLRAFQSTTVLKVLKLLFS